MPAKKGNTKKDEKSASEEAVRAAVTRNARAHDRLNELTATLSRPHLSPEEKTEIVGQLMEMDWDALQIDSFLMAMQHLLRVWNPKKDACFYMLTSAVVNQKKDSPFINSKEVKELKKSLKQVKGSLQHCSLSDIKQTLRLVFSENRVLPSSGKRVRWNLVVPFEHPRTVHTVFLPYKGGECDLVIKRFAPEHAASAKDCFAFHFFDEKMADVMNDVKVFDAAAYEAALAASLVELDLGADSEPRGDAKPPPHAKPPRADAKPVAKQVAKPLSAEDPLSAEERLVVMAKLWDDVDDGLALSDDEWSVMEANSVAQAVSMSTAIKKARLLEDAKPPVAEPAECGPEEYDFDRALAALKLRDPEFDRQVAQFKEEADRQHALRTLACSLCGKPNSTKVCSRCKAARYCSKECQTRHWGEGHKQACQVQDLCPKCHAPMGSAGAKGALCARCSE